MQTTEFKFSSFVFEEEPKNTVVTTPSTSTPVTASEPTVPKEAPVNEEPGWIQVGTKRRRIKNTQNK